MALTFKKPTPKPEPPAYQVLKYPGEIRAAILSGKRFGLYTKVTNREWQYHMAAQTEVVGHSSKGEIFIGYLAANEDGVLVMHQTQVDNPDYTSLSSIWYRYWRLLENGCRLQPDIEFRFYE